MAQKDRLQSADLYRFGKGSTSAGNSPSGHNEETYDEPVNINVYCEIEEEGREKRRPGSLFFGLIGSILDGIVGFFYLVVFLALLIGVIDYFSMS
ncbi:hypothetical protein [Parasutterella secunda]|uniref:Uncharacterized protein n=1 Tax=Parasutterella secunda TaxID=626947 RepID=A0ABS2GW77_9BURK|nr:hypothetical protein [Parasutterella secunda]MBM6928991.1 hypothetical protein [Parasutterella secunda]